MGKVIKLTETQLRKIIKNVIKENEFGERPAGVPFGRVKFNNGESISIQAGRGYYCEPRENNAEFYSKVEMGFPSENLEIPKSVERHREAGNPESKIFIYVPVEHVFEMIELNGGVAPSHKLPPMEKHGDNDDDLNELKENIFHRIFGKPNMKDATDTQYKSQGFSHMGKEDNDELYMVFNGEKFYEDQIEYDDFHSTKPLPRVENGKLIIANPMWSM